MARRCSKETEKSNKTKETWILKSYVAGQSLKSVTAFENLKKICEEHLGGKYQIEIIDIMKNRELAKGDQILAIPTAVKLLPLPVRRIIGNMANTEKVLIGLDL